MAPESSHAQTRPGATRRVVSLTKYIPFHGVTHAGGQYVLDQDQALSGVADVFHFAPDTPINREALMKSPVPATLLRGVGPGGAGGFKAAWDVESAWAGSALPWPWRRLFATDAAPWEALESADIIEFHWSEMIALAPLVRQRIPGATLVGIAHDVITQRWSRAADGASGLSALAFRTAAARSRRRERVSFAALDVLIVFSEKDAALARSLAPNTRIEVVHPGLGSADIAPHEPDADRPIVLFTGALGRPDNARGISWFVKALWPSIHRTVPSARLVVAGAGASDELKRVLQAAPNCEVTGFVESLDPYYSHASVFIAPLLTGAGVKFKTIDAMLRGAPVVATEVGAEGIEGREHFAAITDDGAEFADAVIAQLENQQPALGQKAQRWANDVYGVQTFTDRVQALYRELLASANTAEKS